MSELEKQIEAAHHELVEEGGFTCLPGMADHDFDHCNCGLGWPMGSHHQWDCPAHCICGAYEDSSGLTGRKQTCCYHRGEGGRVPVGPSLMTERWDLPEGQRGNKQNVPKLERRTSGKIQAGAKSEEAGGSAALPQL